MGLKSRLSLIPKGEESLAIFLLFAFRFTNFKGVGGGKLVGM
jgi:hypothetical protein